MKAIHYKGQNKFYLFDKPEEPRKKDFQLEDDAYIDPIYYDALDYYEQQLESNLSSGKEIINPEVLPDLYKDDSGVWFSTGWNNETGVHDLKPCDIFDLLDNIRFEEEDMYHDNGGGSEMWTVIRLFLKDESKACPKCRTKDYCACHSMHCPMRTSELFGISEQLETQDDLWNEVGVVIIRAEEVELDPKCIKELKSKFTITRNQ